MNRSQVVRPRPPFPSVASARLLPLLLGLATASVAQAQPTSPPPRFHVVHYAAQLEPDMATRTLQGRVALRIVAAVNGLDVVELDRGDLTVESVRENGRVQEFVQRDRRLEVRLSRAAQANEPREITIEYRGAPHSGLLFFPDRSQIYTVFSTSQWLVCINAPEERATLQLSVILPPGLSVVANGRLIARRALPNGTVVHEWRQDRPVPSYTFGFAAGRFTDVIEQRGRRRLRYLGDGFSEPELRRIFAASADMIAFFEDRAGIRYPEATYTQALVVSTIGQEMSGFSVMPEAYGRAVLTDARNETLGAHELAHQWWGNMVTCRDWTHFWLNEGFATFMAAAYNERRLGRQEYLRNIAASRARYEKVRDAGHDRSLVFPNWDRPTADDRTLVYHKGAYVLHLLRERLGERAFWDGVRHYTRTYFGRSVTTADFQRAMEDSSGKNLSDFFAEWIYRTGVR